MKCRGVEQMKDKIRIEFIDHPLTGRVKVSVIQQAHRSPMVSVDRSWFYENIVSAQIPFLHAVPGAPQSGIIRINKIAVNSLSSIFTEINNKFLLGDILSFDYCFYERVRRNDIDTPSLHCLGIQIDLNLTWNPDDSPGAHKGETGHLDAVAPIFERYGWRWGAYATPSKPSEFTFYGDKK